ncbi:MAG TPA: signal peptidase I [Marmoricola sp.]
MTHPDAPFQEKEQRRSSEKKAKPLWLETVVLLGVALILAIGIKAFFVQAFYIPSPSMEPQFVKNDRILVEKVSYWGGGTPQRGDIVVFKDPGNWLSAEEDAGPTSPITKVLSAVGLYPTGGHLVKRVVAVGGDTVSCAGGRSLLTINGHALHETSYIQKGANPCSEYGKFNVHVPKGSLWVMGDNRDDSADSRAHMSEPDHGFVRTDLVVGKVFALVWPLGRAEIIHRPADFKAIPDPK